MAPITKHGYHEHTLHVPALAAGSAADDGAMLSWHFNASNLGVVDLAGYQVRSAALVFRAGQNGQATHFFSACLRHYDKAGSLKNELRAVFSAAATPPDLTALVPQDLTGALGTYLTNPTGTVLPWDIVEGDSLVAFRLSNDGTGLASAAFDITVGIGAKGA